MINDVQCITRVVIGGITVRRPWVYARRAELFGRILLDTRAHSFGLVMMDRCQRGVRVGVMFCGGVG